MIGKLKPLKELLKRLDKVNRKQLKKAIETADKSFKKEENNKWS